MVSNVARPDVGEGVDGERVPARNAAAHPCVVGKVLEESQRRGTDGREFVDETRPRSRIGFGRADGDVLIEARKWVLEAAREPKRAKHKESLGVVHVTDRLTNAPFVRG